MICHASQTTSQIQIFQHSNILCTSLHLEKWTRQDASRQRSFVHRHRRKQPEMVIQFGHWAGGFIFESCVNLHSKGELTCAGENQGKKRGKAKEWIQKIVNQIISKNGAHFSPQDQWINQLNAFEPLLPSASSCFEASQRLPRSRRLKGPARSVTPYLMQLGGDGFSQSFLRLRLQICKQLQNHNI
jgi:hypothetical protein